MNTARDLRVLILGDHFGYAGGVVHGVTTYYINILPRLRDAGVSIGCCFLGESHPAAARLRSQGIEVRFLEGRRWNPFLVGGIEQVARAMGANVVHAASMKSAALGRIVAKRLGAAFLLHSHDLNIPPLPLRLLYGALRLPHERGLAVSRAAADCMELAYRLPRPRVTVLPNAIDVAAIQAQAPGPLPDGVPASSPRICWAGRLHEVKGPRRMLRILRRVVERLPQAQLVMAGDGPEREACAALTRELGLEGRVAMLGQRADLPRILQHVELLCVTSHSEGFSLVAAEAAAVGVPVVAFDVGGVGEVVRDGVTGLMVPDGDEEGFATAVRRLLADEPLRLQLGGQARVDAHRFGMEQHVAALIGEYRRAVGEAVAAA